MAPLIDLDAYVTALEREVGLAVCDLPYREVVKVALSQAWRSRP